MSRKDWLMRQAAVQTVIDEYRFEMASARRPGLVTQVQGDSVVVGTIGFAPDQAAGVLARLKPILMSRGFLVLERDGTLIV